jgi:hypothetical protein
MYHSKYRVRERIEYRFRVPSAAVFTLYSYFKPLEYHFKYHLGRVVLQAARQLEQISATSAAKDGNV